MKFYESPQRLPEIPRVQPQTDHMPVVNTFVAEGIARSDYKEFRKAFVTWLKRQATGSLFYYEVSGKGGVYKSVCNYDAVVDSLVEQTNHYLDIQDTANVRLYEVRDQLTHFFGEEQ